MICNFLKQHRLETLHTRDLTKELAASLAGQRCAFGRSRIGVGCEALLEECQQLFRFGGGGWIRELLQ
jgi:hypothetical protein